MSIIAILGSSRRRRDSYVQVATYFEWIVAPANVSLASIGGTASVLAAVTDQYHRQMTGASQPTITYTSGTTANITVAGSTLTAVANGTSVITAHAATGGWTDLTGTATVAQVVASATISPTAPSVAFGRTQQFTLTAKDSGGTTIASPPSPTWVALSNLDGSAWGTITSGGLFTASTGAAGNRSGFIHATYPNGVVSQNAGVSLGTPTLSSIDTTNLPQGSTALSFTLTGTFFGTDATPVVSGLTGVTVADFTVVSATSITGHFSVSASAPIASGTIQVSSVAAGNSGTEAISVTSGVTALNFTSVSPSSAVQGSNSVWQFFSSNANTTTTVVFSVPGDFTVTSYDYTNLAGGFFTANVAVGGAATIGTDTVHLHDTSATLSDSGNVSLPVVAAVPPAFTSITPSTIAQNTSATYTIVGTNLTDNDTLGSLPAGVSAIGFLTSDSSHATVTLSATATAPTGAASIKIHDPLNGDSGTQALTVTTGTPSGTARTSFHMRAAAPASNPSATQTNVFDGMVVTGAGGWRKQDSSTDTGGSHTTVSMLPSASVQASYHGGWVSDPLSEQFIPAGTYTLKIVAFYDSGSGTVSLRVAPIVYVYRPSTATVVGVIRDNATGLGTADLTGSSSNGGHFFTFDLATSFAVQRGDVLITEIYVVGTTNLSPSAAVHVYYDGNVTITDNGGPFGSAPLSQLVPPSAIYTDAPPLGVVSIRAGFEITSDSVLRSMIPTSATTYRDSSLAGTGTNAFQFATDGTHNVDLVAFDSTNTVDGHGTISINAVGNGTCAANVESITPQLYVNLATDRNVLGIWLRRTFKCVNMPNGTLGDQSCGYNNGSLTPVQNPAYKIGPMAAFKNYDGRIDIEWANGAQNGTSPNSQWTIGEGPQVGGAAVSTTIAGGEGATRTGTIMYDGQWYDEIVLYKPIQLTDPIQWVHRVWLAPHGGTVPNYLGTVTKQMNAGLAAPIINRITFTGLNFNQMMTVDQVFQYNVVGIEYADAFEAAMTNPFNVPVEDLV